MTLREAVIQAHVELGISREEAELRTKMSDACIPDALPYTESPVIAGLEREFIEELKRTYRLMDANPKAVQEALRIKMAKRTQAN
jgi:hypothetical protein